jgi:nitroimidazol reductase NimA-like FMN-containing flavoprotein (pyridoxamine 5'-phosphate oxidase superfamily)
MTEREPATKLDPRYSSENAQPTAWEDARKHLEQAEIFWLSTVRPDGRPHVTPLLAIWLDGALYFNTGADERKAKNIAHNGHCILTTGSSTLNQEGLDLVVEGDAVRVTDQATLQSAADAYAAKYGSGWRYIARDGALYHAWEVESRGKEATPALVFAVAPTSAFGFGKGQTFSQTRWRF